MAEKYYLKEANFITEAQNKKGSYWKYLIPSFLFFGLIGINLAVMIAFDIDQSAIIKKQIDEIGRNMTFVSTIAPLSIFCLLILLYVKFVHKQSIRSLTTTRPKIDWSRVFFSFALITVFLVSLTLIDYATNPADYKLNFELIPFLGLLGLAVVLIPLQTSFEEYFFRAYLMQGIGGFFKSRLIALIFTSVIFGLMHIANPEIGKIGYVLLVTYIGTGFLLGIMTLMDEGIELALGFHAANNLITVLLVTTDWTAFQTNSILISVAEPSVGLEIFIPVFVIYPLYLFIFSKKYKWSNWKEKLLR
ncbi:CPBP family intramembrane metalloprotease domain-containing protein [Psychroflexus sp. S27]|uniref:CPBP family intramembrane glutamic endopeptidase n=1 Tax=Psychroflexus sp. S27 TaxID=1982757 RepID=UPI000C2A1718|nr:type II CAAX endopeptidase family protein [Psychroflexus sp. S27]PJX25187.1 CPBP family intramembrane metalloprotease domain-containing protein [Psychroflexus sp. S27]